MSDKINGKTLEEIEAVARAATEGPWESFRMTDIDTGEPIKHARLLEYLSASLGKGGNEIFFVYVEKEDGGADVCISGNGPGSPFNAAHIATMDPPTTLAMVSHVRELKADVERLGGARSVTAEQSEVLTRHGRDIVGLASVIVKLEARLEAIYRAGDVLCGEALQMTVSVPHKVTQQADMLEAAVHSFGAACIARATPTPGEGE